MTFRFGAPCGNEYHKYTGGKAGDQLQTSKNDYKGECRFSGYSPWYTYVARPKNSSVASKIALSMERLVDNPHIGYSQGKTRLSLYPLARKLNFRIDKVTTDCECDCSAGTSVCINSAGIAVPSDMCTATAMSALKQTNAFKIFKSNGKQSQLKRGDIVWKPGYHIAVVCTPATPVKKTFKPVAGTVYVLTSNIRLRTEASKLSKCRKYDDLSEAAKNKCLKKKAGADAIFRKGVKVRPVATKGNWIKLKSGWLCWKTAAGKLLIKNK